MNTETPTPPILDLSTQQAKKNTFRKLVQASVVLLAAQILSSVFLPLSDSYQIAQELESEIMPQWQRITLFLAVFGLLGVSIWGLADLWHFKATGLTKLALCQFAPLFLIDPGAVVSNGFADYLVTLDSTLTGMMLFMGWANPRMFSPASGASEPAVEADASTAAKAV